MPIKESNSLEEMFENRLNFRPFPKKHAWRDKIEHLGGQRKRWNRKKVKEFSKIQNDSSTANKF